MAEARITVRAEDLASEVAKKVGEAFAQSGQQINSVNQVIIGSNKQVQQSHEETVSMYDRLKEAIENPAAAAKELASSMLESVGGIGAAGVALAGIVTVAGAAGIGLMELADHSREVAARIEEVSQVTGMSVGGVSAMKFAFESAGGSIDGANNLMFMFEQRMENSGKKVETGLQLIGLSLQQLKDTPADQRIYLISDALRAAGEETNKAAVAMDLFGRQGRDNLPLLLKPLSDLRDAAGAAGAVLSKEDTEGAESFQLSLNTLKAEATAARTELGLHATLGNELSYVWERTKLAGWNLAITVRDIAVAADGSMGPMQAFMSTVVGELPKVKESADWLGKVAAAVKDLSADNMAGHSELDLAAAGKEDDAKIRESIALHKQQQAEAEKEAAFWREYNAVGESVTDTIDKMDGAVVEGIKYDLQRGESQTAVAKAYGVTAEQIKAIVDEEKFLLSVTDDTQKKFRDFVVVVPTLTGFTDELRNSLVGLTKEGLLASGEAFDVDAAAAKHLADAERELARQHQQTEAILANATANQPFIGLPNVKPSGILDDIRQTQTWHTELNGIAKAFSEVAQVSDGSMAAAARAIGGVITGANLGMNAVDQMADHIGADGQTVHASFANMATGMMSVFSLAMQYGPAIANFFGNLIPGDSALKKFEDKVQAILDKVKAFKDQQKEVDDAISNEGFKTKDQLLHEADIANQAYEKMLASGKYKDEDIQAAYLKYQQALAATGDAAAAAWVKAHQAMQDATSGTTGVTSQMTAAQNELQGLINSRDQLAAGLAKEAPEAVKGVIQTQQEGELAALDAEIQRKADAYAQLAKDTGQQMAQAITDALSRLHVNIDIGYNLPPGGGRNTPGASWNDGNGGVAGGKDRGAPEGDSSSGGPTYDDFVGDYDAADRDSVLASFPGHADGGVFSTPHFARIAEGGQSEIVGSVSFIQRALEGALSRVGAASPNIVINHSPTITMQLPPGTSPDQRAYVQQIILPEIMHALDHNVAVIRTEMQEVLGIH